MSCRYFRFNRFLDRGLQFILQVFYKLRCQAGSVIVITIADENVVFDSVKEEANFAGQRMPNVMTLAIKCCDGNLQLTGPGSIDPRINLY